MLNHRPWKRRNVRTADENRRTLEKFKSGELDVLLNVKMLTEGTDVPQTKTVFITRQTTSAILLTQMVGRAFAVREPVGRKRRSSSRLKTIGSTKSIGPILTNWSKVRSMSPRLTNDRNRPCE